MGKPAITRVRLKNPTYIAPGYLPHAAGTEIDLPVEHASQLIEARIADVPDFVGEKHEG